MGFTVFKEGCFFSYRRLVVFTLTSIETRKSTEWRCGGGDAVVFYGIEICMSFSSIWDICAIVGCRMIVWEKSCQLKCDRQKSHGGAAEG
jgi:hypothetical protein